MTKPIIDSCIHHHWASQEEIVDYMPRGWQEFLNQPKAFRGPGEQPIPILPSMPYRRPEGDKLGGGGEARPNPGTSLEALREQVLDRYDVERAVLGHDAGMYVPLLQNTHLAREVTKAINDWTIERWLSQEERLHSLLLVPNQTPDAAAAEIERLGDHPKIAGVLMAANGLSKPFGHPLYHPIYAAAAEWELPIVIHAGGDMPAESLSHPTGGGLPTSYGEYHVLRPQALMTHLVSLVAQGVFEKFPTTRVLVVGGGATWIPSVFWRFDTEYRAYRRETPWVTRMPSEYLRESIRVSTWPLDLAPSTDHLSRNLEAFGGFEDLLIYGSGYADWDTDTPDAVAKQLPDSWASQVLHRNALDFFRWDAPATSTEVPAGSDRVGAME